MPTTSSPPRPSGFLHYFLPALCAWATPPLLLMAIGAESRGASAASLPGMFVLALFLAVIPASITWVVCEYRRVRREQAEQAERDRKERERLLSEQRTLQEEQRELARLQAEWLKRQRGDGAPDPGGPAPEPERKSAEVYVIDGGKG